MDRLVHAVAKLRLDTNFQIAVSINQQSTCPLRLYHCNANHTIGSYAIRTFHSNSVFSQIEPMPQLTAALSALNGICANRRPQAISWRRPSMICCQTGEDAVPPFCVKLLGTIAQLCTCLSWIAHCDIGSNLRNTLSPRASGLHRI